mgnify:CR=1 FL=1
MALRQRSIMVHRTLESCQSLLVLALNLGDDFQIRSIHRLSQEQASCRTLSRHRFLLLEINLSEVIRQVNI